MMLKFKTILLFGIMGLFLPTANTQDVPIPCGTQEGKVEWLTRYQANPNGHVRTEDTLYVPITIHVVGTDEGMSFFSEKSILDAFCTLNEDFKASKIQFFIEGEFNYLSNSAYNNHDFSVGYNMMLDNNVTNTINCYIVNDPAGACGYSYYDAGVALSESCISPSDHTWSHEMGHNLSLPHTFYGWEGESIPSGGANAPANIGGGEVEKVDGSNCAYAADGFCDTPADYLSSRWQCNENNESYTLQRDPNGQTFRSDATLFMSYSSDNCASRFSDEQIEAMRSNLYGPRQYLLYNQMSLTDLPLASTNLTFPTDAVVVGDPVGGIQLEWDAVPNATHYIVELNPFNAFSVVVLNSYVVTTPTVIAYGLLGEHDYYWRVKAYNNYSTCTPFSEVQVFVTGVSTTGLASFDWSSSFQLYPNPLSASSGLTIAYELKESTSFDLNILDATGKLVYYQKIEGTNGKNEHKVVLSTLPDGLYLFNLRSNEGQIARKVVIRK